MIYNFLDKKKNSQATFYEEVKTDYFRYKKPDSFFYECNNYIIALNGVIVNLNELISQYNTVNKEQLIKELFLKDRSGFVNLLQGTFSILIFEKQSNQLILFTDQFSSYPLFYFCHENVVVFGHNLYDLVKEVKSINVDLNYDWRTFSYMSKYGHMPGNATFFKGVKKLQAGKCLIINSEGLKLDTYHKWSFSKNNLITFEEAVDQLNDLFEKAVALNFSKDLEIGKGHIGSLSGGLDSRMTMLTASKLGFKNINNFTFSNKGYWDEVIAKQIAKKMGYKGHFYYLNNRQFSINDFNTIFKLNSGTVMYHLITHLPEAYENLPLNKFGYLHTGQIGDAIVGNSLHPYSKHLKQEKKRGFYNEEDSFINDIWFEECTKYSVLEETQFQNHVFNFAFNGDWITSNYIPSLSPFLNQKLMGFCLDLPLEFRNNQRLYMAWMKKYYPKSGSFYYEKYKKITFRKNKINNKILKKILQKIEHFKLKRLGLDKSVKNLLGLENLKAEFQKNKLESHINDVLYMISDSKLKSRLINMTTKDNIHSSYLALHIALTLKKYNEVINSSNELSKTTKRSNI